MTAYVVYALSAYTLVIVCVRIPHIVRGIKKILYGNHYMNRYLTEKELRIRISLYSGLAINICFAIFKVIVGILYDSGWLMAMAGYHTVLSVMRFVLVYRDTLDRKEESAYEKQIRGLHSYRTCGWLMLLLNTAISVIVIMVVVNEQEIAYPGFMIYAIAAYTFYCLIMAIIQMVKYWHRQNPVFSAIKRMEFAKALVSIFTMQVAMLTQFGANGGIDHQIYHAMTGGIVCTLITIMAVLMLVGVRKDLLIIEKS